MFGQKKISLNTIVFIAEILISQILLQKQNYPIHTPLVVVDLAILIKIHQGHAKYNVNYLTI
jgi:hypothetical protein